MANTFHWYAEGLKNVALGNIDFDGATNFKMALFTSSKTITQDTDSTYSSTDEVANGNGYTTGGQIVDVAVNVNTTSNEVEVRVYPDGGTAGQNIAWSTATITARHAILYLDGATKYLVGYMTFGDASPADVSSTNGTFALDPSDANGVTLKLAYS